PQDSVARDVIIRRCRDVRARLYKLGRDIKIVRLKTGLNGTRFTFEGLNRSYPNLRIRLIGRGQAVNAGLAVAIVEALRFYGIIISAEAIRKGLSEACWPGRFEVCPGHPRIILDGAQNEASALALAETIRELFSKKVILVFGACVDKDVKGMISALLSLSKQLIITRAANPRALSVQEIRRIALTDNPGIRPQLTCSVKQALRIACRDAQDKDIVLITGSLFVVGEAKKCVIATAIMLQK
ncbi:MAG: bifunctional folylpolyglutamate synthase/dihydrofolate synthase, partial [Candidatus Omnitrophota bacterium]